MRESDELDQLEAELAQDEEARARVSAAAERPLGEKVKHGPCKGTWTNDRGQGRSCSKVGIVWMPAQLCERCLLRMLAEMGGEGG